MGRISAAMASGEIEVTANESTYVCKHCRQHVAGVKGAVPQTARDFGRSTTTTLAEHKTASGDDCPGSGQRPY